MILTIAFYLLLLPIFAVGLIELHLVYKYVTNYRKKINGLKANLPPLDINGEDAPFVTVQLPIFNEKFVVDRLLRSVAEIEYPRDKFEIQLLDDSTDDTPEVAAQTIASLKEQFPDLQISHVQREDRVGYKAGALQYGLQEAKGEFVAVFDADFVPPPNFLLKTIPYFHDKEVGVVQTRWGHINEKFSLLTRLQAFMLNAHFSVEQAGRNAGDCFINFNGTAGVWRRSTIDDAGGWEADTLTEDLDLSYRAQLKKWKFVYLRDQISPAELPATIDAFKSQQHRWNKGGAETAKKLAWRILTSDLPLGKKIHAGAHLTYFTNYLFVFLVGLLSVPLLYCFHVDPKTVEVSRSVAVLAALSMLCYAIYFCTAYTSFSNRPWWWKIGEFVVMYPLFLSFFLGMSFHNAIAIVEGYLGFKSPFVRTPKLNVVKQAPNWTQSAVYLSRRMNLYSYIEGLLAIYFMAAAAIGLSIGQYELVILHLQFGLGFVLMFIFSVTNAMHAEA